MARLLLLAPLLVACSSSGNDATPSADAGGDTLAVDARALCAKYAAAFCTKFATCAEFFVRFGFGDVAGCEERVALRCRAWATAPGNSASAAVTEGCTAQLPSLACGELLAGTSCALPAGNVELGQPCGMDEQCKSGFCPLDSNQCGKCAEAPAEGAACLGGSCGSKRRCVGMTGVCVTPRRAGEPCTMQGQCVVPLSCFDGRCSAPAPLDAACSPDGTSAPDCDFTAGHLCVENTCIRAELAAPGGACGFQPGRLTLCAANGTCASGSSPTGTCVAAAADGEPCDDKAGPRCRSGATCVSGICRLPDPMACR